MPASSMAGRRCPSVPQLDVDVTSGGERRRFHVDSDAQTAVDISDDGARIAVLTNGGAQVWDTAAGTAVGPVIAQGSSDIALSPDGQRVALSLFGIGAVFNPADGSQLSQLQAEGQYLRFIDDDRLAVSGAAITVVDAAIGAALEWNATTCGCDLAIDPDGRTAATRSRLVPGCTPSMVANCWPTLSTRPGLANAAGFSTIAVSVDARRLSASAYGAGTTIYDKAGDEWRLVATTPGVLGTMQPDGPATPGSTRPPARHPSSIRRADRPRPCSLDQATTAFPSSSTSAQ